MHLVGFSSLWLPVLILLALLHFYTVIDGGQLLGLCYSVQPLEADRLHYDFPLMYHLHSSLPSGI